MKVKIQELKDLVNKALLQLNYSQEEATIIGDVLLYAQLRGNNQGIVKLLGASLDIPESQSDIKVVKETKLSQLIDGGNHIGMVVKNQAMEVAISKAKEHGFGIVGIKNTRSSTGAIGYFARKIAEQGLIGIVMAGSPPTVNPHGSYEAKFGTNPMAFGLPSDGQPYVFDMATSAMAYFGLIQAKTAGESIPEDVAYDNEGNETTDPAKAMEGAIKPFDRSYKGYGLALLVEAMCGPLVAASYVGLNADEGWGNLVMAIDPELLVDLDQFKKQSAELYSNVKSAKKLDGVEEVFIPGEKGDKVLEEAEKAGEIEIEGNLYNGLKEKFEK